MVFRLFRAVGPRTRVALAFLLAVLAFGAGAYQLTRTVVTCGTQVMAAGDICEVTRNGSTTNQTFESQRHEQQTQGYVLLGVGAVCLVAGGFFVTRVRRQPASEPATAS